MIALFTADLLGALVRLREEAGHATAEYALVWAFIGVVAGLALTSLGGDISAVLTTVADKL